MKRSFQFIILAILGFSFTSCEKNDDSIVNCRVAEAYPGTSGEVVYFINNQDTLFCEKINGEFVFQGDIILSEEQLNNYVNKKGGAIASIIKRWPTDTVYFTINDNVPSRERIVAAIASYHSKTNVKFVSRSTEKNYVEFIFSSPEKGTWSELGMTGGKQQIGLANWAESGDVIHEIGHTLGLIHEHCRSDRDLYVKIWSDNIIPGKKHNFKIVNNSINSKTFDWNSIMLYPPGAFTKNEGSDDFSKIITITTLNGNVYSTNNIELSTEDVKFINMLYPSDDQISETGLVAIYPFNGNADDESGNSLNGTVYNAALTSDKFGTSNEAYSFNGVSSYITVANSQLINFGTSDFAIYAQIKTETIPSGSWSAIISKHNTANFHDTEFFLMIEGGTGRPFFGLSTNAGVFDRIYGSTSICDNKYHALCGIRENGVLKLYVDGRLIGTKSSTINPNNTNPLNIGRSSYNSGYGYFKGIIDEVKIFNRALTNIEIQLLGH